MASELDNTIDVAAEKAALRSQVIARRNAVPADKRHVLSEVVCANAARFLHASLPEGKATVGLFSSLGSEVDTRPLMQACADASWRIALPVMFKNPKVQEGEPASIMRFVLISCADALERQEAFLAKPARPLDVAEFDFDRFPVVEPEGLDALIVPLVAFGQDRKRLGYGGGNYDRYVPQLRDDCRVAGMAFSCQGEKAVPCDEYDCALPLIITELSEQF